ncbi:MAG: phosphoribosylformylglycinamidine synthase subunit PurS [Elusimicrobia bacterium]|nr:phosphoribosylformylglycinamidine synthase subunit PurS [Elusimicrobiota bacterium]
MSATETAGHIVEVGAKPGMSDTTGAALIAQIQSIGVQAVQEARVLALYDLRGKLSAAQVTQAAKDLLADPVTQDFRLESRAGAFLPPHWRLEVWLKPSMTDSVGESVKKAVRDLGLPEPSAVRTGQAYQLFGKLNKQQVDRILERLLSNPVIHRTSAEQR